MHRLCGDCEYYKPLSKVRMGICGCPNGCKGYVYPDLTGFCKDGKVKDSEPQKEAKND